MAGLKGSINHRFSDLPLIKSSGSAGENGIFQLGSIEEPAICPNGRYFLAYEGEIYNWRVLQGILEDIGHDMNKASISRILLFCFLEWELDFLSHIQGMYTLALWDSFDEKLILARDRLSGKRLYFAFKRNFSDARSSRFLFSTRLDEISQSFIGNQLNHQALHHYLALGGIPNPHTIYTEVNTLPAGHFLIYQSGKIQINRYWQINAYTGEDQATKDAPGQIRSLLEDSLRMRKPELGDRVFILDSDFAAGLALIAGHNGAERPRSISLHFPEFETRDTTSSLIPLLKQDHFEMNLTGDQTRDLFLDYVAQSEQPDARAFIQYLQLYAARSMGNAAVFGLGAPILFYSPMHIARLGRILQSDTKQRGLAGIFRSKTDPSQIIRKLATYDSDVLSAYDEKLLLLSEEEKTRLYSPTMMGFLAAPEQTKQYLTKYANYPTETDPLAKISRYDIEGLLSNMILPATETKARSLHMTIQVPYFEYKVINRLYTLPHAEKALPKGKDPIFFQTMRTIFPQIPRHALFYEYEFPFTEWMRKYYQELAEVPLFSTDSRISAFFDMAKLRSISERFLNEETDGELIWNFVVLEQWLRTHE